MPYTIYPFLLYTLSRLTSVRDPTGKLLTVTFVISAYNEADVIAEKIENTLALDYPQDLLQIVVLSDESNDATDDIVANYVDEVQLIRQVPRQGKSAAINNAFEQFEGEVIVFSDANAIYQPDAVKHLVRHFGDTKIGYVVGRQSYLREGGAAQDSENTYWDFELKLKSWESRLSSVVGGDGAIMAIRRELFSPLRPDDINDFVLPLRIIAAGYQGCFESKAICYEKAAPSFRAEFRRKVRIVNRSLRAVTRVPSVLNPLRVGVFSAQLFCHKVIRWFALFFMCGAFLTSGMLAVGGAKLYLLLFLLQCTCYVLAIAARRTFIGHFRPAMLLYYFCIANIAGGLGVLSCLIGRKFATWTPQREAFDSKIERTTKGS